VAKRLATQYEKKLFRDKNGLGLFCRDLAEGVDPLERLAEQAGMSLK